MGKEAFQDYKGAFEALPVVCAILSVPDFRLEAVTDLYLAASERRREDIIGKKVFEAFPENPYEKKSGKSRGPVSLRQSLEKVLRTKHADKMGVFRYDIELPQDHDDYVERWWRTTNTPLLNKKGEVAYIINFIEDVNSILDVLEEAERVAHAKLKVRGKSKAR